MGGTGRSRYKNKSVKCAMVRLSVDAVCVL